MNHAIYQADSPPGLDANAEPLGARLAQQPITTSLPCAISSEALLRGQPSISITHQGAIYRLQITRQGKLILTK
jgi:hemin uptake protein HemP